MLQFGYMPALERSLGSLICFFLIFCPVVFSTIVLENYDPPRGLLLSSVATSLFALWMAKLCAYPKTRQNALTVIQSLWHDPISISVLALLFSAAVSTLTSVSPALSFWGGEYHSMNLLSICPCAIFYFGARAAFQTRTRADVILTAIPIAAAVNVVYGLIQVLGLDFISWKNPLNFEQGGARVMGLLGHPIHFGTYLAMALPFIAYLAWRARKERRRLTSVALFTLFPLSSVCILFSGSRGAWLGATAGILAFVLGSARSVSISKKSLITGAAAFAGPLVLLVIFRNTQLFSGLWQAISYRRQHLFTLDDRAQYWQAALDLFKRKPFFGSGLETFQVEFQNWRTIKYWTNPRVGAPFRAHNELLQLLVTQGMLGAGAAIALVASIFRVLARKVKTADADSRALLTAVGSSLIAALVALTTGFTVIPTASLFLACAALVSGLQIEDRASKKRDRISALGYGRALGLFGIATLFPVLFANGALNAETCLLLTLIQLALPALLIGVLPMIPIFKSRPALGKAVIVTSGFACVSALAWFAILPFVAEWHAARAANFGAGFEGAAVHELELAVELCPYRPMYYYSLGQAAHRLGAKTVSPRAQAGFYREAVQSYRRASDLLPDSAKNYFSLGDVEIALIRGRHLPLQALPAAKAAFDKALELEPNNLEIAREAKRLLRLFQKTN
ncbi:MAG: O-antigen ligase family protein [Deltaproteobacteria bacterium]|nr:O-antigen ligase family protein [Deltaproteobacteria bacterium]